jgi:hypothetical protein
VRHRAARAGSRCLSARPFETEREAAERQVEALDDVVGTALDVAGKAAELGSACVGNVVDYLTDD